MIQITPHMRILLAVDHVDFRKGIDGLARTCRQELESDPFSGFLFVFINRRKTAIKILQYDTQGFWLHNKRLSSGRYNWWPENGEENTKTLHAHELQLLIWNGNPDQAKIAPVWRKIAVPE